MTTTKQNAESFEQTLSPESQARIEALKYASKFVDSRDEVYKFLKKAEEIREYILFGEISGDPFSPSKGQKQLREEIRIEQEYISKYLFSGDKERQAVCVELQKKHEKIKWEGRVKNGEFTGTKEEFKEYKKWKENQNL